MDEYCKEVITINIRSCLIDFTTIKFVSHFLNNWVPDDFVRYNIFILICLLAVSDVCVVGKRGFACVGNVELERKGNLRGST